MYEVKNDVVLKLLTKGRILRDIVNVRLSETLAPGYFNFVLFFSNLIEMLYMYHNNTLIMLRRHHIVFINAIYVRVQTVISLHG